ncbi:MAG: hypothetical protein WBV96_07100, partial [Polyangia bacterium]
MTQKPPDGNLRRTDSRKMRTALAARAVSNLLPPADVPPRLCPEDTIAFGGRFMKEPAEQPPDPSVRRPAT